MRRPVVIALALGACGFSVHTNAGGDDAPGDASGVRDAPTDGPNGPDGMPFAGPYRRALDVVDARVTGGPHTDFAVYFDTTQDWLRTRANGGLVTRADANDVWFSLSGSPNAQALAHEVERYTPDTGRYAAWIRVPSLEPSTTLFVHYGDPTRNVAPAATMVWPGYVGVWHGTNAISDSTGTNTAVAITAVTDGTGKLVDGRVFDGDQSSISVGSASAIDDVFAGGATAQAWIRATSWGESGAGRIFSKSETAGWVFSTSDGYLAFGNGFTTRDGLWLSSERVLTLDTWHHVVATYSRTTTTNVPTFYVDGQPVVVNVSDTPSGNVRSDAPANLRIGNNDSNTRAFHGTLDELRVFDGIRTDAWIATEYANQNAPSMFFTLGPEQPDL